MLVTRLFDCANLNHFEQKIAFKPLLRLTRRLAVENLQFNGHKEGEGAFMSLPPGHDKNGHKPVSQPAINLPPIVLFVIACLVAVQLYMQFWPGAYSLDQLFINFGYLPQREALPEAQVGGWITNFYTLFSHAFLHSGWEHLFFNVAWLAVFGSPVTRRYGNFGFILVFLFGSALGALTFEWFVGDQFVVLIGASGAVSALIGGALRFMFQPIETRVDEVTGEVHVLGRKLAGIGALLTNQRAFTFAAFWLGINILLGVLPGILSDGGAIAWQAHLGGFVAGFVLVAWLEKRWI